MNERALRLARESLVIAEEMEHLEWQCGARRVLGVIALQLCSTALARQHLQAAHDIARRLASATWMRWTAAPLAIALARSGDASGAMAIIDGVERALPASATHAKEAGADRRTLGEKYLAIARAEIALVRGAYAEALTLVDANDAIGTPTAGLLRARAFAGAEQWDEAMVSLELARADATTQHAPALLWRIAALEGSVHLGRRRRLDARRAFDTARVSATELLGELDTDAELAAALRAGIDVVAPPPPEPTPGRSAREAHGGLTQRERETASLIAQGKSNRAIARALGIGERTVEGYVASALDKLGFNSRAQIAAWVVEQGQASAERRV